MADETPDAQGSPHHHAAPEVPPRPSPPSRSETSPPDAPGPTSDARPPKRRRRWPWVVVAVLVVLIAVMLWRRHTAAAAAAAAARQRAAAPITVSAATATRGDIGVYLDAIGTVTPVHTASITAQVTGSVTAVHYREGQMVKAGDPLLDIDDRPYRATLMQAEGTLARDENLLAQAQMDLKRYQAALARNAIAEQTAADQEKVVLQDEGVVKNDQGTVRYDQLQVAYCHIGAPFAGIVGLRLVDPGNLVQSNGTLTLAVVTQMQPITVIFTIPEDSLGSVRARLRAGATLPAYAYDRTAQVKIATGALLALDNQIDTTTGTVKGRATFPNTDMALFPNQFVNIRLLVDTHAGVTLVPSSTIERNGQMSYVYVIQQDVAHERNVRPGVTDGNVTEVVGVTPGEVLANSSFEKLQNNAKVVIAGNPATASRAGQGAPPPGARPSGSKVPAAAVGSRQTHQQAPAAPAAPPSTGGGGKTP